MWPAEPSSHADRQRTERRTKHAASVRRRLNPNPNLPNRRDAKNAIWTQFLAAPGGALAVRRSCRIKMDIYFNAPFSLKNFSAPGCRYFSASGVIWAMDFAGVSLVASFHTAEISLVLAKMALTIW